MMGLNNLNGISSQLALNGIVPYDMGAYLYGAPPQNLASPQFTNDAFISSQDKASAKKGKSGWKTFGALFTAALATAGTVFALKKCGKLQNLKLPKLKLPKFFNKPTP
ncbi:hypothetical protein tpqmel_0682 [Candidatus Gastranaerophilus sp. (ex Termes propinquus)]|nr:hypothetical protein tpqmel_0682 [Candidatus Gastranaerophilus sp. (ex Termes propinquus)]